MLTPPQSSLDQLFDALDSGSDGALSRSDLHRAARRLGWHWDEAPLYAVLDVLTLAAPLSRAAFLRTMKRMLRHPRGPYGDVLLSAPRPWSPRTAANAAKPLPLASLGGVAEGDDPPPRLASWLRRQRRAVAADDYETLLEQLADLPRPLLPAHSALLLIDPQRSFTVGTWARSIGGSDRADVEPLRLAFAHCRRALQTTTGHVETAYTRCPFPPDSYGWDERVAEAIAVAQPYFIKPGNSALWPSTNGFCEWVDDLVARGKRWLVMGGCTLNSCVRVSACETAARVASAGMRVVVDLSLCGARADNYQRSPLYGHRSSVESAVRQMSAAGVAVVEQVPWVASPIGR